jgi:hypothetical protein
MHLEAGDFLRGSEARSSEFGWVTIEFYREIDGSLLQGSASIGGNAGRVRIRYDPERDESFGNIFGCGSSAVHVADHEIVHVMGYRHTSNTAEDFQSGWGCPGAGRPNRVSLHASALYARPYGNVDVDSDPAQFMHPMASRSTMGPVAQCAHADIVRR